MRRTEPVVRLLVRHRHRVRRSGGGSAEEARRGEEEGETETLPNAGLQLFDVVTVTDSRARVASEVYRVRGIEERYDTTKEPMVYGQRVGLGGQ